MENLDNCEHKSNSDGEAVVCVVNSMAPPSSKRSITDISFLVLFSVVFIVWLSLGGWVIGCTHGTDVKVANLTVAQTSVPGNASNLGNIINKYRTRIIIGLFLALLTTIIFIILMRWIAKLLLFACIGVFTKQILFFGVYYTKEYVVNRGSNEDEANKDLILVILSIVALLIFSCFIWAVNKRNKFAIALVNESNCTIRSMRSIIFLPVIPGLIQIAVIIFTITVAANLSIKSHQLVNAFDQYYLSSFMHTANIIVFLWTSFFISALLKMTLAGTYGTWYWTYNKEEVPSSTLPKAFTTTFKYHLGSVALGSLTINFCHLFRLIFNISLKKHRCNPTKCLYVDFLRNFTENAYVMSAIHGKSLNSSGHMAYKLHSRNSLRYISLESTTEILFGVCKVVLMVVTGVMARIVFVSDELSNDERSMMFIPIVILTVGAYLIAGLFANVYSIAVDTLVLCFLEDRERNDGSDGRPFFMSKRLMQILVLDNVDEPNDLLSNDTNYHYNNY